MKKLFILFLISLILITFSCKNEKKEKIIYHCPMHPTYTSDKEGNCPICGMKLVPIKKEKEEEHKGHIMPKDEHKGHKNSMEIKTSENLLKVSGIEKAKAYKGVLSSKIKAVGIVLPDERRIKSFYAKVSGWIEELFVNFEGQYVQKDMPLLSIYSQELYNAQIEFLAAKKGYDESRNSNFEELKRASEILYDSAKKKLLLFDVPKQFIEKLEKDGVVQKNITLKSPFFGFVLGKDVFQGKKIESGMELFKIVDLSKIWIEAEVYESEAPFIFLGQSTEIFLPFDSTFKREGNVNYIYPYINGETRTLKLRIDLENKDYKLKPSMYVDVYLKTKEEEGIIVPETAIVDTGLRKIAFVEVSENNFEIREVEVGLASSGKTMIRKGISEGEIVASKGTFLLDSESKLGAAFQEHKH